MFVGRFYLFFTIYSGIIVICKMIESAKTDIYTPNDVLKKNTSIVFRKILYILVISFFVYALGFHIILDLPRLVNRDFMMYNGYVQKTEKISEYKYNVIIEDSEGIKSFNSIYGENLEEGDFIQIALPPNPLYGDIVVKKNNNITNLYQKHYGNNFKEKVYVFIYCLLNVVVQNRKLRKAKHYIQNKAGKHIHKSWTITLYFFTFVLLLSLTNIINNFFMGILAGGLYFIYNLCYLIISVSRKLV